MIDDILHELEAPPDATETGGHEVLRCFVVDGGLSVNAKRLTSSAAAWRSTCIASVVRTRELGFLNLVAA